MTLPVDLANIVYGYIPEAAEELSFQDQRHVVREMTGYLPSDPIATKSFLADPQLWVLVDDPVVFPQLQQRVLEETGVLEEDKQLLKWYLRDGDLAVLALEMQNWNLLEERDPEAFHDLLFRSGSEQAFSWLMQQQIEVSSAQIQQCFVSALRYGDMYTLSEMVGRRVVSDLLGPQVSDEESWLDTLTLEELQNFVRADYIGDLLDDDYIGVYTPNLLGRYFKRQDEIRFRTVLETIPSSYRDEDQTMKRMLQMEDVDSSHPILAKYLAAHPTSTLVRLLQEQGLEEAKFQITNEQQQAYREWQPREDPDYDVDDREWY